MADFEVANKFANQTANDNSTLYVYPAELGIMHFYTEAYMEIEGALFAESYRFLTTGTAHLDNMQSKV